MRVHNELTPLLPVFWEHPNPLSELSLGRLMLTLFRGENKSRLVKLLGLFLFPVFLPDFANSYLFFFRKRTKERIILFSLVIVLHIGEMLL